MAKIKKSSCSACEGGCTKHKFDKVLNTWVRCPNADISFFNKDILKIPPSYRDKTWNDYETNTAQRKAAKDFGMKIEERLLSGDLPKKTVLFSGKDFSGKTFLSSIIARNLAIAEFKVSFVSLSVLTDLYFQDRNLYFEYVDPDFLVLQMGSEIPNSSAIFVVRELFTQRLQQSKYTLFTSKYPISDFKERYSPEMYDFFSLSQFKEVKLR